MGKSSKIWNKWNNYELPQKYISAAMGFIAGLWLAFIPNALEWAMKINVAYLYIECILAIIFVGLFLMYKKASRQAKNTNNQDAKQDVDEQFKQATIDKIKQAIKEALKEDREEQQKEKINKDGD